MATLSDVPAPARALGFAGLIPFVAGGLGAWAFEPTSTWWLYVLNAQVLYGCMILSFLGAVHWGRALAEDTDRPLWGPLGWSVMPSLLAWTAALAASDLSIAILVIGLLAAYLTDRRAVTLGWFPEWYGVLRRYLSVIAVLALGASLIRLLALA